MADYTLVTETAEPVRVVGTANQVVLSRRTIRRTRSGYETIEAYGATSLTSAKAFQVDCLNDERCSDCDLVQEPPDITLTVRWAYDRTDSSWNASNSVEQSWEMESMESSRPLASHPYFVAAYVAGSGTTIMDRIVLADNAIATGKKPDTTGDYAVWMQRYAGLKIHGVEDWVPHGVILRRKSRIYKSIPDAVLQSLYNDINRSYELGEILNVPDEIRIALQGLTFPTYNDAGDIDPNGRSATKLMWIKKAPQFSMVGRNPKGPRDVVETWIGAQYVSAVLYPPHTGLVSASELWDPKET